MNAPTMYDRMVRFAFACMSLYIALAAPVLFAPRPSRPRVIFRPAWRAMEQYESTIAEATSCEIPNRVPLDTPPRAVTSSPNTQNCKGVRRRKCTPQRSTMVTTNKKSVTRPPFFGVCCPWVNEGVDLHERTNRINAVISAFWENTASCASSQ